MTRSIPVCDFSHNQASEIAVKIEAVLDSRVKAHGDGRLVRSGMLSDLTK
jgi:hypothetical protein